MYTLKIISDGVTTYHQAEQVKVFHNPADICASFAGKEPVVAVARLHVNESSHDLFVYENDSAYLLNEAGKTLDRVV